MQLPQHVMVEPSIVWTKEDSNFKLSTNQQLNFSSLMTSDSGQYTCTVTIEITGGASTDRKVSTDLVVYSK